jgi:hypothetical protein
LPLIKGLTRLNRDREDNRVIERIHLLLLSLYLYGAVVIALRVAGLSLAVTAFLASAFFMSYLAMLIASLFLTKRTRLGGNSFYFRCCFAAGFSATLVIVLAVALPMVGPLRIASSRLYFYDAALYSLVLTTTFILFYSGGYHPSSTVESLKVEISINLQMLYLFLLGFVTIIAGTMYSQILGGAQFTTAESLAPLYGTLGLVVFIIIPQGKVIADCAQKLRQVEEGYTS